MNIEGFSTNSLTMLHKAIQKALDEDDSLEINKIYEVREHPDFKQMADAIESMLTRRKEKFERIEW